MFRQNGVGSLFAFTTAMLVQTLSIYEILGLEKCSLFLRNTFGKDEL